MNQQHLNLWIAFCQKYINPNLGVPLFSVNNGIVEIKKYGKNERLILTRSQEMENFLIQEVQKVLNDYENQQDNYEGLIYMMYFIKNNRLS